MSAARITDLAYAAHLIRHDVRRKVVVRPHLTHRLKRVRLSWPDRLLSWPWEPWISTVEYYLAEEHYLPGPISSPFDCAIEGDVIFVGEKLYEEAMRSIREQAKDHAGVRFQLDDRITSYAKR